MKRTVVPGISSCIFLATGRSDVSAETVPLGRPRCDSTITLAPFFASMAIVGSTPSDSDDSDDACFIATAAFGSYMEPEVKILRDFRDRVLLTNFAGKAFVGLYYKCSPPVADFIAGHSNLRVPVRLILLPLIGMSWVALNLGSGLTPACMILLVVLISVTSVMLFSRGYSKKI